MYESMLTEISKKQKKYDEQMQPPCFASELKDLQQQAQQQLGTNLPEQYLEFLSLVNGLEWNGLVVFASQRSRLVGDEDLFVPGIVDANLEYREDQELDDYLIFAEDGEVWFCLRLSDMQYLNLSRVGMSVYDTYDSFEKMLANALSSHL